MTSLNRWRIFHLVKVEAIFDFFTTYSLFMEYELETEVINTALQKYRITFLVLTADCSTISIGFFQVIRAYCNVGTVWRQVNLLVDVAGRRLFNADSFSTQPLDARKLTFQFSQMVSFPPSTACKISSNQSSVCWNGNDWNCQKAGSA